MHCESGETPTEMTSLSIAEWSAWTVSGRRRRRLKRRRRRRNRFDILCIFRTIDEEETIVIILYSVASSDRCD